MLWLFLLACVFFGLWRTLKFAAFVVAVSVLGAVLLATLLALAVVA